MFLKKSNHPSGEVITFNERFHLYNVESDRNVKFISGTTFLKKFFPAFDSQTISLKYAEKHNLKQEDVLFQWKEKGRISAEEGTEVHKYMEDLFFDKNPVFNESNERVHKMQQQGLSLWNNFLMKEYDLIEAEKIVASIDLKIAGMVDLIGVHKQTGRLTLLDYKTNASFDFSNKWQKALFPISHLDDTKYNKYSLQLALYQYIIEKEHYYPSYPNIDRVILHIMEDEWDTYSCPEMKREITSMIAAF